MSQDRTELERAQRGDRAAFFALYERHADASWRLGVATGRDLRVAQDAVVHAFARVLGPTRRHEASRLVPVSTRILAVTRETAIDGAAADGATDLAYLADAAPDGTALAFDGLPEKWRSVLWLLHGEHLDLAATAAVLGLSGPEAEQLGERALAGFREQLALVRHADGSTPECRGTVRRLGGYAANVLTDTEAGRVRRHLDACEACRERLDEVDDLTARLRDLVPALPLAIEAVAADAWLARIHERSGPIGLRMPGGQLAPAWAERGLATATAAVVSLGITAALMLGARGSGSPTEGVGSLEASGLGEQALGGDAAIDIDTTDFISSGAITPSSNVPDATASSPGTDAPAGPPVLGPSPSAPAGDVPRGEPVPATKPPSQPPTEPAAPPEAPPPSTPPSAPPESPLTVVDDIVEALDPVLEGVCGAVPVCPPPGVDTTLPALPPIPGL